MLSPWPTVYSADQRVMSHCIQECEPLRLAWLLLLGVYLTSACCACFAAINSTVSACSVRLRLPDMHSKIG